MNQIRKERTKP